MDYWRECIEEAFEESEIVATQEQVDNVIAWVDGYAENESLATGTGVFDKNLKAENEAEVKRLEKIETDAWHKQEEYKAILEELELSEARNSALWEEISRLNDLMCETK